MTSRSPARGRLSRSAEFERVYRHGRSTANRQLVLYAFPNPAVPRPRLGVSVSRKVGGAVQRNRMKRLLREAFSDAESALEPGQDVVIVARPPLGELAEREGKAGVEKCLSELIEKVNNTPVSQGTLDPGATERGEGEGEGEGERAGAGSQPLPLEGEAPS